MVEEAGTGKDYPLSGEKLSLLLTVYRAKDFADAKRIVHDILNYQGKGHSCGIHTTNLAHARELAEEIDVARVLVNQAHTFGNGGGFDNGLPFTLSMGCGTWQGNSISENRTGAVSSTSPIRDHHPGGQAQRGNAVRRLLGQVRKVSGACRAASTNPGLCWRAWRRRAACAASTCSAGPTVVRLGRVPARSGGPGRVDAGAVRIRPQLCEPGGRPRRCRCSRDLAGGIGSMRKPTAP